MNPNDLPLQELSIQELFNEKNKYEIPIYQRNYAWGKDEIETLVRDIQDSCDKPAYYIGTLVTFRKDENVFEVIDGQQRLTTIYLILLALKKTKDLKGKLTYKARPKSDKTLESLKNGKSIEDGDQGIESGYKCVEKAVTDASKNRDNFKKYFLENVKIIHYQVPRDIDLNHYFEIMNSRGEQLEKHEIVKAKLMNKLEPAKQSAFNKIWEACSKMSTYVQRNLPDDYSKQVFGDKYNKFCLENFDHLFADPSTKNNGKKSINDILDSKSATIVKEENEKNDTFQPIIDFPNFLLIVLKITKMLDENDQEPKVALDDKELLNGFYPANFDSADKVKKFAYNLLKARFFLDNYIVHHSTEEDQYKSNPWQLQVWTKEKDEALAKNLTEKEDQEKLVQLLSMFEVSYSARQRKNYLFYCLYWLMKNGSEDLSNYKNFLEKLAKQYFFGIYLNNKQKDFDEVIINGKDFAEYSFQEKSHEDFKRIADVPLFVFNYLDYKIWNLYAENLKGKNYEKSAQERQKFFEQLGCSDFGLEIFNNFYFSRTRNSLEHFYPQANAAENGPVTKEQMECFGNYAMIGSKANSSGSNWSPKTKLNHYLDSSGKINQISVASLKFMIMMRICKDNNGWNENEIKKHQEKMISILFDESKE
ncbi:DUF262 domain-containing protein [bacterium]|nr:DUF262 domain-containing protein [bacterium]